MKNSNKALSRRVIYFALVSIFLMLVIPANATHQDLLKDKSSQKHIDRKQLEAELGRKLTFKERIAVFMIKRSIKKRQIINAAEGKSKEEIDVTAAVSAISGGIASGIVLMILNGILAGGVFLVLLILTLAIAALVTGITSLVVLDKKRKRSRALAVNGLILGSAILMYALAGALFFALLTLVLGQVR